MCAVWRKRCESSVGIRRADASASAQIVDVPVPCQIVDVPVPLIALFLILLPIGLLIAER
jgi:hypothetical protein